MIFWCRRWMLHSRSPRWTTLPWVSASTWISMCLGRVTYRSISSVSSPNAARASRRAAARAAGSSPGELATRMPLPPPPAEGLTRTGNHRSLRVAMSSSSDMPGAPVPGTTGTPAAATVALAAILSPIASIAPGGGPMKVRPAAAQARANRAFSARNP